MNSSSDKNGPLENPHSLLANELLFLGLYDEGAPEFAAAKSASPATASTDLDYTLAIYQLRGGHVDQAVRFGELACYRVRAVRGAPAALIEGPASEPVCERPKDSFPPAPPGDIGRVAGR